MQHDNFRYGTAAWATNDELRKAKIIGSNGVAYGFTGDLRHEMHVVSDQSVAAFVPPGGGKTAALYATNMLCGYTPGSFVFLDFRNMNEVVELGLTLQGYEIYRIDPMRMSAHPSHSINVVAHLKMGCHKLIPNAEKFALNACAAPPSDPSPWPFKYAQEWLEAFLLYDTEKYGTASIVRVYDIVMSIQGDTQTWIEHVRKMSISEFPTVRECCRTIVKLQKQGKDSFTAPMKKLREALGYLKVPGNRNVFGGDSFNIDWLFNPNRKIALFLNWDINYVQTQNSALRATIGSIIQRKIQCKTRSILSFLCDEVGQLGPFPSLLDLLTFGRGEGMYQNILSWQSPAQVKNDFGEKAQVILDCCQIKVFKGVSSFEYAQELSGMLGSMTLEFDQKVQQSDAGRLSQHAATSVMRGSDYVSAYSDLKHFRSSAKHKEKQARMLLDPAEIMKLKQSAIIAFYAGSGSNPALGHWINYFDRKDFDGLYLNDKKHSDFVSVRSIFGKRKAGIIEEPVPEKFAHLPQYADGTWRFVEGLRPKLSKY